MLACIALLLAAAMQIVAVVHGSWYFLPSGAFDIGVGTHLWRREVWPRSATLE